MKALTYLVVAVAALVVLPWYVLNALINIATHVWGHMVILSDPSGTALHPPIERLAVSVQGLADNSWASPAR